MNQQTFTARVQAVLKDPRAGLLPAELKSLIVDMCKALDAMQSSGQGK